MKRYSKRLYTKKRYSKKRSHKKRYSKKRYSKKRSPKKRYSKKRKQRGGSGAALSDDMMKLNRQRLDEMPFPDNFRTPFNKYRKNITNAVSSDEYEEFVNNLLKMAELVLEIDAELYRDAQILFALFLNEVEALDEGSEMMKKMRSERKEDASFIQDILDIPIVSPL